MRYIVRGILMLVFATLSAMAFSYHQEAKSIEAPTDPRVMQEYADIASSPFDALVYQYAPRNAHDRAFSEAMSKFWEEDRAYSQQISHLRSSEQNTLFWAVWVFVAFLLSLLPWRTWLMKVRASVNSAGNKAADLTSKGITAYKSSTAPSPVIGRHGLKSYSVADELLKWSKLREEGLVTDAEFEEARKNLMSR